MSGGAPSGSPLWPLALFLVVLGAQRTGELLHSARNTRRLVARGAREHGAGHFPMLVLVHALFPLCLTAEVVALGVRPGRLWALWLALWLAAQALRVAAVRALGERWSVRILVLPGEPLVRRGPYRFLRHPNYLAVVVELLAAPLMFGAWRTAIAISLLDLVALRVRIRAEEVALRGAAPAFVLCLWMGLLSLAAAPAPRAEPRMRSVMTIPLPGVEGRVDHMALDVEGQRLFVAALGNNSVEVIDLRSGRRVRSLTGFREPQGVGFSASPPRLFVANGGDGSVFMLDAASYRILRKIRLAEDADNVRIDPAARRVYVGFGGGALAVLDGATGDSLGRVELPGHPEAFQLENRGPRAFVNVPEAGEVSVVDRARGQVIDHWRLDEARANFPMALDPAGRRLFIGCRQPAVVLLLDAASGKRLAKIPVDGDPDDLFFDARTRRLYVSCGAGWIDIVSVTASGSLVRRGRIPTAPGARTSLFDERRRRLFLAVPHRGRQAAEVRVFEVVR